jgi:hypothetical protein
LAALIPAKGRKMSNLKCCESNEDTVIAVEAFNEKLIIDLSIIDYIITV